MKDLLVSVFGANWRTSISGITETICIIIMGLAVLPREVWQDPSVWLPAAALLVAKSFKDYITKDKEVTGGTKRNDPPANPPGKADPA